MRVVNTLWMFTSPAALHSPLARYIGRRLTLGAVMLLAASLIVFVLTQALPGDVAHQVLGQTATDQQIAALRSRLGLDHSVAKQYLDWIGQLSHGDLGESLTSRSQVASLILPRLANSALLVGLTSIVLFPLVVYLALKAAQRPGGRLDLALSTMTIVSLSIPEFVIAVLLVAAFATNVWHLFPPTSLVDSTLPLRQQLSYFVLPMLALIVGSLPYSTESLRVAIAEELRNEYVLWARLCGISEARILLRHVLPNALAPSLQVMATTLIYLTGGIVAVENVFAFPGMGSALTTAVADRDIPMVQAISMLMATLALLIYLSADLLGVLLTPRLRTGIPEAGA